MLNKKIVLLVPEKLENNPIFSMTAFVGFGSDGMSNFKGKLFPEGNLSINASILKNEIIPTKKKKHPKKEECKLHERIFEEEKGWLIKINLKPGKILDVVDALKQILGDGYEVQLLLEKEEEKMSV